MNLSGLSEPAAWLESQRDEDSVLNSTQDETMIRKYSRWYLTDLELRKASKEELITIIILLRRLLKNKEEVDTPIVYEEQLQTIQIESDTQKDPEVLKKLIRNKIDLAKKKIAIKKFKKK